MEQDFYFVVIGIILILHVPYAFISSKEVIDYPLWGKKQKVIWFLVLWLLPFIGAKIVHKKINLKSRGNNTSGGDPYTGGADLD